VNKICPKCGKELIKINGNGYDKDLITCISCDYEVYLETSTKAKVKVSITPILTKSNK
jgi:uncharacterized Zn finger protein (UPF0148 family)